jgi:hypothetical protein
MHSRALIGRLQIKFFLKWKNIYHEGAKVAKKIL